MNAARAFVAQRSSGEQIAFVTFNNKTNVALPLTKTGATIAAAIDHTPALAYGTRMYDSVSSVVKLLSAANLDSASIVLLSDGADTGSATSLHKTLAAARAAHVRIFTVGLHSKKFDPSSLQSLASGANGVYAQAEKPSELAGLFHHLGNAARRPVRRPLPVLRRSEAACRRTGQRAGPARRREEPLRGAAARRHPGADHVPPHTVRAHHHVAVHRDRGRARLRAPRRPRPRFGAHADPQSPA